MGEEGREEESPWSWASTTGNFWEAAVDGLMLWVGLGARFREADWMVEAISMGREEDMVGEVEGGGYGIGLPMCSGRISTLLEVRG